MSQYSIAVVVPYFGQLPDSFSAWWISARRNSSIDFLFFTDNEEVRSEGNIKVTHIEFEEMRKRLQDKFEFPIVCDTPYKLCDYKPTYGTVFYEELQEYDFWGYCDIDLVFGNIRDFITSEILTSYDKIFIDGHISLYRNTERLRSIFRIQGEYPEYNYQEAFSTNEACYFDEYRGMELKCIREKIRVYTQKEACVDISPRDRVFQDTQKRQFFVVWESGKLMVRKEGGYKKEIMYVHFQKRKMRLEEEIKDYFIIAPGRITANKELTDTEVMSYTSGGTLYSIQWLVNRFFVLYKQYGIKRLIARKKRMYEIQKYKDHLLTINLG